MTQGCVSAPALVPGRPPSTATERLSPGRGHLGHIPALDGLRGVAILLVLVVHLFEWDKRGVRFLDWIYRLAMSGWIGVDLFFALSGFLITGILIDSIGTPNRLRNFYVRRVLRIFPLYYGLLIIAWVVSHHSHLPGLNDPANFKANQFWLWTYTINLRMAYCRTVLPLSAGYMWFPHFWTLAVEEQFYLFWPLLINKRTRPWLPHICVALLTCGVLSRIAYRLSTGDGVAVYVATPFHADGLLLGSLAAIAVRNKNAYLWLRRHWAALGIIGLTGLSLVVARDQATIGHGDLLIHLIGYTVLGAGSSAVILCCVSAPANHPVTNAASYRPLRLLGKYSYGIYALHFTIMLLVGGPVDGFIYRLIHSHTLADAGGKLFSAIVSVAAAVVSYHCFEMPFLRLKRFFPTTSVHWYPSMSASSQA